MTKSLICTFLILITFTVSCKNNEAPKDISEDQPAVNTDNAGVPAWSREAVWYQVFVERFRNGDANNDPTLAQMKDFHGNVPESWKITPWGHDWYQPDDWFADINSESFYYKTQYRRYGGDLQGVLDKLDYIKGLGVNAIYFNPVNDAPSLHKFDARNWRHIDINFGPDPTGDIEIMASEEPENPATWQWTAADKLFLKVVEEAHKRGIKIVVDYSWNHTGRAFWAFKDILEKGKESAFKDWYEIEQLDDPNTPENEMKYTGWAGISSLPEMKKIIEDPEKGMPHEGNLSSEAAKKHIFAVASRWLDPNGDGNPEDGIDGFRLDVAAEVPLGFWRSFRTHVKSTNPDAYLVGEVWWEDWPYTLMDPEVFLKGDVFDAIMNYRWYKQARRYFGQTIARLTPKRLVQQLKALEKGVSLPHQQAMMNLTASHDSPRVLTSLFNKGAYKYLAKPADTHQYKIHRPDEATFKALKMLLLHQFTYIGAPHIWNGDEVGMWGADDPDCRKPLLWSDEKYDDESAGFQGEPRPQVDAIAPDMDLYAYYASLGKLRTENKSLIYGDVKFLLADDEHLTFAYSRKLKGEELVIVFNRSYKAQEVSLKVTEGKYQDQLSTDQYIKAENGMLRLTLDPSTGVVLKRLHGLK